MRRFLGFLFPLPTSPLEYWQGIVLYMGTGIFTLSRLGWVLPDVFSRVADRLAWDQPVLGLVNVMLLGGAVLAYYLTRRGNMQVAAAVLAGVLLAEGAIYVWGDVWNAPHGLVELWIAVILAGLLLKARAAGIVIACAVLVFLVGVLAADETLQSFDRAVAFVLTLWTLGTGGIVYWSAYGPRQAAQTLIKRDAARVLIEIGEQIGSGLFSRLELDMLLGQTAQSIEQHFESIYHVQIYVIESGKEQGVLRAATGAVGQQLLAQEYAVDVGGLSVVGRVAINGEPLLISDYNRAPIHKPQVLLPETRSELAVPLVVGEDVVGVLDVQSKETNAFSDPDVTLLRSIGSQIAVAVDSLQLYESAQRSLRENRALLQQTQASLHEIERLNYQLTGRAWTDYLRLHTESLALTLDVETGQVHPQAEWTPTLNEAATYQQVITTTSQGRRIIALPIVVRNDVIGAMEFELEADMELPEGAQELVVAVGQRLGLAMENRRLFDETQRAAQREALINDIGKEIQAATGVDAIIQRTAHHLQQALEAQQITVRIGNIVVEQEKTGL